MSPDAVRHLHDVDRRNVWHPFTQMRGWMDEPQVIVERAEGNWLVDIEGRRYLDGVSSLWVAVHGHRVERIDRAVREQLDRVAHSTLLGLGNVPSIELAERLVDIAPDGLTRVFYSDSGSTAVEIAVKIAFQYWQQVGRTEKRRFVCLAEAYHGDTIGSVSVGGIDLFHELYRPLLFETLSVPTPYRYRLPESDRAAFLAESLGHVERLFDERASEIGAFIIEPLVQGAAGMLLHVPGFLSGLRELCDRHDVLLIADEVATGFGRTGRMFACEHEGVSPDLMCLAKGISGGYLPLAATLASERVFEGFLGAHEDKKTFFHGHTYTGNPLACAAGIASLDVFAEDRVLEGLPAKEAHLAARLAELERHANVGEIRRRGMMAGVELFRDPDAAEPFAYADRIGHRVIMAARAHGLMVRPLGDVIILMPPLSLSLAEIDHLVDGIAAALDEVLPG